MNFQYVFSILPAILLAVLCGRSVLAEEPPDHLRPLLEAGNISFVFYDARRQPREYPAKTEFAHQVDHEFRYAYRTERKGRTNWLVILPQVTEINISLSHRIELPSRLNRAGFYDDPLVRHELDHAAITCDSRVKMLLHHLLENAPPIRMQVADDFAPAEEAVREMVNTHLKAREQALNDLIQFNNQYLDKETVHGTKEFADREAFFQALYTKANLDAAAFPYTGELLRLLAGKAYGEAGPIHLP